MFKKLGLSLLPVVAALSFVNPAVAAIDVSDVTDAIADAQTGGLLVAAAVLVMLISFKAFKWIRSAA